MRGGVAGLKVEGGLILGDGGVEVFARRSGVEIGEFEMRRGGVGIGGDGFLEGGEGFGVFVRGGEKLAKLEFDDGGFVGRRLVSSGS